MASGGKKVKVGVLALQGSFREHCTLLNRAGAEAVEVRKAEHLNGCSGLIIPGGESTTMANIARRWGLFEPLREFAGSGRAVWGTCAGLIFLAERATGQKEGGQELLGGLDVTVNRNFFGSQIDSFECEVPCKIPNDTDGSPYRCIFIRAPAILQTGPKVEVLAEYKIPEEKKASMTEDKVDSVAVAVKQGTLMATSFHPELTADFRWHQLFLSMSAECQPFTAKGDAKATESEISLVINPDLPVFTDSVMAPV